MGFQLGWYGMVWDGMGWSCVQLCPSLSHPKWDGNFSPWSHHQGPSTIKWCRACWRLQLTGDLRDHMGTLWDDRHNMVWPSSNHGNKLHESYMVMKDLNIDHHSFQPALLSLARSSHMIHRVRRPDWQQSPRADSLTSNRWAGWSTACPLTWSRLTRECVEPCWTLWI